MRRLAEIGSFPSSTVFGNRIVVDMEQPKPKRSETEEKREKDAIAWREKIGTQPFRDVRRYQAAVDGQQKLAAVAIASYGTLGVLVSIFLYTHRPRETYVKSRQPS